MVDKKEVFEKKVVWKEGDLLDRIWYLLVLTYAIIFVIDNIVFHVLLSQQFSFRLVLNVIVTSFFMIYLFYCAFSDKVYLIFGKRKAYFVRVKNAK